MKLPLLLLLAASVWPQVPVSLKPAGIVNSPERSNAPRQALMELEGRLDKKITTVGGGDPVYLIGQARALYVPGYGVVITQEITPVATPAPNPFRVNPTAQQIQQIHQRKLDRVPLIRQTAREMWIEAARSLPTLPDNEHILVAVRFLYQTWENMKGLPAQIVVQGERKAGLAGDLQTEDQ
jgi:hypothetical protein